MHLALFPHALSRALSSLNSQSTIAVGFITVRDCVLRNYDPDARRGQCFHIKGNAQRLAVRRMNQ